jgi:hypothetical protein
MKHVLLTGAVLLSAATTSLSQGVVTFANSVLTPPPNRLVTRFDGTPLVGTQYAAQLYYGPSPVESSLQAHTAAPSRFRQAPTTLPGTWSTSSGASRTLIGGGVGVPIWMQVRVWNLDLFPTYEAARAGGGEFAVSPIFEYVQRLSTPTPRTDDTFMHNFTWPIPEPSALLLAAPGIALLLVWNRRRSGCKRRGAQAND